jgi:hypothetical protein
MSQPKGYRTAAASQRQSGSTVLNLFDVSILARKSPLGMDGGLLRSAAPKIQHALERDFHEFHCSSDFNARFAHEMNFNTIRSTTLKEAHCVGIHYDRPVTFVGQLHKFHITLRARTYWALPPYLLAVSVPLLSCHSGVCYDRQNHAT